MNIYRVEVRPDSIGEGTCNVPACRNWGDIHVTFRDVTAIACSAAHVLPAAAVLVRNRISRSVIHFRVQTYTVTYNRAETVVATSGLMNGLAFK